MQPFRLPSGSVRRLAALTGMLAAATALAPAARAQPETTLDLLAVQDGDGILQRIHGRDGTGQYGVPVAAGNDVDGDGLADSAVAFMTAMPNGIDNAGEVALVFGTGVLDGTLETEYDSPAFLRIYGHQQQENAGSEIWMDDVTGDGVGDLLICRQNYGPGGGVLDSAGAGALTIVAGGAYLRTLAASSIPLELGSPHASARLTTLVGAAAGDRLCIWTRTGDVDGDGIADIVVGADQEDGAGTTHRGAVWVIRGGTHLDDSGFVDLSEYATLDFALPGQVAHVLPPEGSHLHAGATCAIADLDGNGRGEVIFAAALNRAGADLDPTTGSGDSQGGTTDGTIYIAWDDLFDAPWPSEHEIQVPATPDPGFTLMDGETVNRSFGEELVGGVDLDGDGTLELVVGDLVASPAGRSSAGLGHVLFDAHLLRGTVSNVATPPPGVSVSRVWGPSAGAIGADTAAVGDIDGDGMDDLLFTSPHGDPTLQRSNAGQAHVLFGKSGAWPSVVDLAAPPAPASLRVALIQGRFLGDTLAYSAAAGDLNGDGRVDLAINEMNGDAPTEMGVGNLLLISGRTFDPRYVFDDGFETGDTSYWSSTVP